MKDFSPPLFLINSIYSATEGEGIHVGRPQVFIRYQGCTIGCANCDSQDTWEFSPESQMLLATILEEVESFGLRRVSITGGDPLHPKFTSGLIQLVRTLKQRGHAINLEASGARVVHAVFDQIDFISFDYKTPSTGVKTPLANVEKVIQQYPGRFQIKSVVASHDDFLWALEAWKAVAEKHGSDDLPWCLTPAMMPGRPIDLGLFSQILQWNAQAKAPFRVIGQQHKWVFGPDEKQV